MEVNSAVGRADGLREAELDALARYAESPEFSQPDRAALAYAESIARGNTVPEEVFARVRRHFSEDEMVELTAVIVWELAAARFNRALEIEGQGICRLVR